jgi:CzcA family heavy metal efflux pump
MIRSPVGGWLPTELPNYLGPSLEQANRSHGMSWIILTSLRFRGLVILAAIGLMLFGFRALESVPLDVFPEFAPPLVEIQTEAPGISTEDVESLITVPLENAVNGIPFVTAVRSKSVLGLSSVRLIFRKGTNLLTAWQLVQERVAFVAPYLPMIARPPVILPPLSSLSRCLKIGLWSDTASQMDMTVLTKWTIRPRLLGIEGVANVAVWGEKDPQLQVVVEPDRLRAAGVTLEAVLQAVRDATAVGSGGFVDTPNQRLALRQIPSVYTPEQLGAMVVPFTTVGSTNPSNNMTSSPLTGLRNPIRIRDIADVMIDFAPPIGNAIINSRQGLLLIVEKQPWANTLDVTKAVEKAMADLAPGFGDVQFDTTIFRPATFIERALENLSHSMLLGCILVVVVLLIFLFDWRSALISAVAIPLSLITAVLVLAWYGGTVNTMVLAGLVIALGEVVDDAIIDVENIIRRLRRNQLCDTPLPAMQVVLAASMEVRSAVIYATIIVVLAFLPVFFLEGLAGSFFQPLAAAYITAILASLVVALTITPAMALWLLPSTFESREREGPLVIVIRRLYAAALQQLLRIRSLALIATCLVFVGLACTLPYLGEELMPKFKETDFLMHWVEKPGIGIDAMDRVTLQASREMMAVPGVRNFGSHIGRATVADEVVGPNFTELWISIDEKADYDATVAKVQTIVDGYPGLYRDLLTYLSERIKEVLTGTSASIVVRIFGPEMDQLRSKAGEVAAQIKQIEGVTTLKVEPQVLVPQIAVKMKPDEAAAYALNPAVLMRNVTTLVNGLQVGEIYQDQKIFGVVVRGAKQLHADLATLSKLMIDTPSGAQVTLDSVATVEILPAPNEIKREGASRRIDVTCNVSGRDLAAVATDIETAIKKNVAFQSGYHPAFLGGICRSESFASANSLAVAWIDDHDYRHSLRRFSVVSLGVADAEHDSTCVIGRRGRRLRMWWGPVLGFVGWIRDRGGDRGSQCHHAHKPLSPFKGCGKRG